MRLLLQKSRHLVVWLSLLPLLLAFAAYRTSTEHFESVQDTLATDDFLSQLTALLSTVTDAETGQRGYLLTKQESFLASYREALSNTDQRMARVTELASRNGVSREEISQLRNEVAHKVKELQATIDVREKSGLEAALQAVRTGHGATHMRNIRRVVNQIAAAQRKTLGLRIEAQRRNQELLEGVLAFGVGAGFLLLFFSYRFSAMYVLERDLADAEVRRVADTFEVRVEQRTAELKEQTQELKQRTTELQRSNQDLLQFAYIASHDLQEPLRTIGSYVGLLARRYENQLDDTAKTYIQFAVDGASRMQTLINDLLDYSRAGTQTPEKKMLPAERVVKRALTNLRMRIEETGTSILCTELPTIEADEGKLTQVLQNLIGNAIKFRKHDSPPTVTIRAKYESDQWIFSIEDNGIGFEERYTDRIFQVFQRLHGVGKYQGNGIGLAICKRIVEHHGGRLWAHSELGAGSTFFFSLPAFDGGFAVDTNLTATEIMASERIVNV